MSNLEDNPHTFPEVQTLLEGITVGGHKISEQRQIYRIRDGWQTIIDDEKWGFLKSQKSKQLRSIQW